MLARGIFINEIDIEIHSKKLNIAAAAEAPGATLLQAGWPNGKALLSGFKDSSALGTWQRLRVRVPSSSVIFASIKDRKESYGMRCGSEVEVACF